MSTVRKHWGLACPNCQSDEHLQIAITAIAHLSCDGTEPEGDHEWDKDSYIRCGHCAHDGTVRDFRVNEVTP
jgi:hypothetical protein